MSDRRGCNFRARFSLPHRAVAAVFGLLLLTLRLPVTDACAANHPSREEEPSDAENPRFTAGFQSRILDFVDSSGERRRREAYLWYPSTAIESEVGNVFTRGRVALGAEAAPGRFPVVIFSHAFRSGGLQFVQLTERLARSGFVVFSVDHADSWPECLRERNVALPQLFGRELWRSTGCRKRRDDLSALLDLAERLDAERGGVLAGRVDRGRMAVAGHSLGGYVAMSMLGAVAECREPRLAAGLVFCPFGRFSAAGASAVEVPVMIHGGGKDPLTRGSVTALQRQLGERCELFVLRSANHMSWTNWSSVFRSDTEETAGTGSNGETICRSALEFLRRSLGVRDGRSGGGRR